MNMNKPDRPFTVGVIISTYNQPAWLEKTLWGYECQTRPADEIIIADDGSRKDTRELIRSFSDTLPIRHIWHEDKGFRKTEILNRAVEAATADYLIFTDQDLIPRADFIETHCRYARPERFLSGGALLLSKEVSETISRNHVCSGEAFSIRWLCDQGMKRTWKMNKLLRSSLLAWLLNHVTTTKATWNGGNASTWRELIIAANGFDCRMRYGGEDREFGERLFNAGIRSKQLRYSLPLLHLWHTRPYRNDRDLEANREIRKETKKTRRTATPCGIKQL